MQFSEEFLDFVAQARQCLVRISSFLVAAVVNIHRMNSTLLLGMVAFLVDHELLRNPLRTAWR